MIPVNKEPEELVGEFNGLFEHCIFCDDPTPYWHEQSNTPVCQECAKEHVVDEIDYQKKISYAKHSEK